MKPFQLRKSLLYFTACCVAALTLFLGACGSDEPDVEPPVITTSAPSNITLTTATVAVTIEAAQSESIIARGVCWGRSTAPDLEGVTSNTENGTGSGSFQAQLTNLTITKYYIRAYAKVKDKVFYGNEVILDMNSIIPALLIVSKGATNDGIELETTVAYSHSAPITEKGICFRNTINPTITSGTKVINASSNLTFSSTIDVLPWNTVYVRGYVITDLGVFYSNNVQVINIPPVSLGEVTDIDGNEYATTTIGTKVWMAENLRVTKYDDGTAIQTGVESEFKVTANGMYISYGGNGTTVAEFGYLYNGHTVLSNKNVCMTGWHVPSPADWNDLANNLGGMATAGGRIKAVSGSWVSPNVAADNASGFSALPGGSYCRVCLSNSGIFADMGTDAYFWSSSGVDFFYATNDIANMRSKATANVNDGLSIRCVKD
jgi:uncharacterized protein (TIGR02145 family)